MGGALCPQGGGEGWARTVQSCAVNKVLIAYFWPIVLLMNNLCSEHPLGFDYWMSVLLSTFLLTLLPLLLSSLSFPCPLTPFLFSLSL